MDDGRSEERRERVSRVLVIMDERQSTDSVADGLRRLAIAGDVAYDGEGGLERALVNYYDVLVLDRPPSCWETTSPLHSCDLSPRLGYSSSPLLARWVSGSPDSHWVPTTI